MNFSNSNRHSYIQQLASQTFDVLIIGSGITGAGIALDASLRGMRVALVDMQDFAAGTLAVLRSHPWRTVLFKTI